MISQKRFKQLQQQYSAPMPCPDEVRGTPDLYCVAGAFLRFCHGGIGLGFPECSETATAIQSIHGSLSWDEAYDIADHIIKANDNGDIVLAWQLLNNVICVAASVD